MHIDDKLLTHLEKLSMLKIAPDKRAAMQENLSDILAFVEKLDELDTLKVDPIASLSVAPARLREDIPAAKNAAITTIIAHAPQSKENCFVVPRVVG